MNNTVKYKKFEGSIEYSKEDGLYFGKILGIKALVSYEGSDIEELTTNFQNVVDEYIKNVVQK